VLEQQYLPFKIDHMFFKSEAYARLWGYKLPFFTELIQIRDVWISGGQIQLSIVQKIQYSWIITCPASFASRTVVWLYLGSCFFQGGGSTSLNDKVRIGR
jgi:hypothetical protein